MVCSEIYFLNLRIDNKYENVYDITDLRENSNFPYYANKNLHDIDLFNYYKRMDDNYFELAFTKPRAFSISGNKASIVLPYDDINITSYNYCVMKVYDSLKFFFITNYTTLTNMSPSAISLDLEFDAWSNNLYYISKEQESKSLYERKTIDAWELFTEEGQRKLRNKRIYTDETRIRTYTEFENSEYSEDSSGKVKGAEVLWLRCIINNSADVKINYIDSHGTLQQKNFLDGCYPKRHDLPYIYVPIIVVDTNSRNRLGYIKRITDGSNNYMNNYSAQADLDYKNYGKYLPTVNSSYIVSASFTFHVPFDYTIKHVGDDVSEYVFDLKFDASVEVGCPFTLEPTTDYLISGYTKNGGTSTKHPFGCVVSSVYSTQYHKTFNVRAMDREIVSQAYFNNSAAYYSEPYHIKYEARFKCYPYLYKSLNVQGKEYILMPDEDSIYEHYAVRISSNGSNYEFSVERPNESGIPKPLNQIKYEGEYTGTDTAFAINERAYGNQLLANTISKTTGGFIGLGESILKYVAGGFLFPSDDPKEYSDNISSGFGSIGGSVSAIGGAISGYFTTKADWGNMPNVVSQRENNDAVSDMKYNDGIIKTITQYINDNYTKKISNYIHEYGVNILREYNLNDNSRILFDYKKTKECNCGFIKNAIDREIIRKIFNNGVRVWHINKEAENTSLIRCMSFNKDSANFTITQYKYGRTL